MSLKFCDVENSFGGQHRVLYGFNIVSAKNEFIVLYCVYIECHMLIYSMRKKLITVAYKQPRPEIILKIENVKIENYEVKKTKLE